MQDTNNENASGLPPIENNVFAGFDATQAGAKVIASSTQFWIVDEHLAADLQFVQVTDGLDFAPGAESVQADA